MNTEAEIEQAYADFHAGKLGTIPPDHRLAPEGAKEGADSPLD